MEAEFWLDRWNTGQTGWSQTEPHPLLREHWPRHVDSGGDVFVPLCGKSVDMDWLAAHEHRVIGNELSRVGVTEFFADRGLDPEVRIDGSFEVFTDGPFELWCGDFFDMPARAVASVRTVYDRASIVALPPDIRRRYADHLASTVPDGSLIFQLSFEYDEAEMEGPPFSVTHRELTNLYGDRFEVDRVAVEETLHRSGDLAERGLTKLSETVTIMRPQS